MKTLCGLLVLFLAITLMGAGQAISVNGGSIQGTITDSTGAIVPDATVFILGNDTNSSKTLKSDSSGFYSLGPLTPGPYTVTVSAAGFEKLTVKTVVRTGTATNGNFKLAIGSSTETVEVNAGALQINTDQAGVSDVITKDQIDSLPVNGRNFLDLAQIEPGSNPSEWGIVRSNEGWLLCDFDKRCFRPHYTRILLDGQDITDENVGTTIFNVSQGAIGDFQLNRSTQDVSGEVTSTGQVLVSTNSGTNRFHGQAFYNFQDHSALFARTAGGIDTPFQTEPVRWKYRRTHHQETSYSSSQTLNGSNRSLRFLSRLAPLFSAIQDSPSQLFLLRIRETYSTVRSGLRAHRWGVHFFARANYDVNSSSSNFGAGYEIYNNRDNTPGHCWWS